MILHCNEVIVALSNALCIVCLLVKCASEHRLTQGLLQPLHLLFGLFDCNNLRVATHRGSVPLKAICGICMI